MVKELSPTKNLTPEEWRKRRRRRRYLEIQAQLLELAETEKAERAKHKEASVSPREGSR